MYLLGRYSFLILLMVGGLVGPSGLSHTKMIFPWMVNHHSMNKEYLC